MSAFARHPRTGRPISLCHFPWPVIRASRRSVIAKLFEDVRAVRGDGGLGDVVLLVISLLPCPSWAAALSVLASLSIRVATGLRKVWW